MAKLPPSITIQKQFIETGVPSLTTNLYQFHSLQNTFNIPPKMTCTSVVMARAESAIKPGYDLKVTAPARPVIVNGEVAILSDFDGTIFMQDTGHVLFDNYGCGPEQRVKWDEEIKTGARSFREVSEDMWGSLDVKFSKGMEALKVNLEIDSGFSNFHDYCLRNCIPFNVVSAGLKPVLRGVLNEWLGDESSRHIDIIANDATISTDGQEWKPVWLHDSELGHDKAASIQEYKEVIKGEIGRMPFIIFVGDGVSDLPAAREADVIFARRGLRLEEYCIENGIDYKPYDSFEDIEKYLKSILEVKEAPEFTRIAPVYESKLPEISQTEITPSKIPHNFPTLQKVKSSSSRKAHDWASWRPIHDFLQSIIST